MMRTRGHVRQRGENSFQLTIWNTDAATGEKRQSWITFRGTLKEAKAELTKRLREADNGDFITPAKRRSASFWSRG